MKYPCDLIRDIMPLYHDEVASEESRKAVEEHLEECSACKEYYDIMCESDVVETATYDEESEKKAADSYKKVYKKIVKKMFKTAWISVLAVLGGIIGFFVLFCGYFIIQGNRSWEEHRDIEEYALLANGESVLKYFHFVGEDEYIWPRRINDSMKVEDYLLIYYNPFDSNYLGYLTVSYDEEVYKKEVARLTAGPSTEYIGRYGVTGFEDYELLAMNASSSGFIYAITDEDDTITYVAMLFPGYAMDIEYEEYVPEEYLPEGLDISEDNPTRQKVDAAAEESLKRCKEK